MDVDLILENILADLREKNAGSRSAMINIRKSDDTDNGDFFKNALEAIYISVFTARMISLNFMHGDRKIPFLDYLVDDFVNSLKTGSTPKKYRFNFPREESCILFWQGLKKLMANYIQYHYRNAALVPIIRKVMMPDIVNSGQPQHIAQSLLHHLSEQNVIAVYHVTAPIYMTSSIILNPNDPVACNAYLMLQSANGEDQPHKLTGQELTLWKLFVWESLKTQSPGISIAFADQYQF